MRIFFLCFLANVKVLDGETHFSIIEDNRDMYTLLETLWFGLGAWVEPAGWLHSLRGLHVRVAAHVGKGLLDETLNSLSWLLRCLIHYITPYNSPLKPFNFNKSLRIFKIEHETYAAIRAAVVQMGNKAEVFRHERASSALSYVCMLFA